jgi:hypothetical protein
VLEDILVYWVSLSFILEGVLEKARRISFKFLWDGQSLRNNFSWVAWRKIVAPKEMGGWGIENIHCVAKELVAKCAWRIIEGRGLWCKVVKKKCIEPMSMEN